MKCEVIAMLGGDAGEISSEKIVKQNKNQPSSYYNKYPVADLVNNRGSQQLGNSDSIFVYRKIQLKE